MLHVLNGSSNRIKSNGSVVGIIQITQTSIRFSWLSI